MIAPALQGADALIVNVALPQLGRDLGGGIELGTWVMTSYLCATAVTAPLTGWLRRRYGAQHLFHGAVWAFIATSLLCAFAPSGAVLILLRVLQGGAGGIILPLVQAILVDLYPKDRKGRVVGMGGAVFMPGRFSAPLWGGVVPALAWGRGFFLITPPLGRGVRPATRGLRSQRAGGDTPPIDGIGIVL